MVITMVLQSLQPTGGRGIMPIKFKVAMALAHTALSPWHFSL